VWGEENAYRVLMGKPEGKRPPGRHQSRWEDNLNMDLTEIGWGKDWIMWLRVGPVEDSCEDSNELFGLHKYCEIPE
jgi:hypothetical protein